MQIMQAPTRLPGENLTEMLRARVKPEQMQQARHNAYLCGMTVSEFVRYRLFGRVAGAAPAGLHPRIVRTLHSFGFKLQRQISALRNNAQQLARIEESAQGTALWTQLTETLNRVEGQIVDLFDRTALAEDHSIFGLDLRPVRSQLRALERQLEDGYQPEAADLKASSESLGKLIHQAKDALAFLDDYEEVELDLTLSFDDDDPDFSGKSSNPYPTLRVRITLAEKRYIQFLAAQAGKTDAEYVRFAVLNYSPPHSTNEVMPLLVSKVNALTDRFSEGLSAHGTTLNALALAAHTGRKSRAQAQPLAEQITLELHALHSEINTLQTALTLLIFAQYLEGMRYIALQFVDISIWELRAKTLNAIVGTATQGIAKVMTHGS